MRKRLIITADDFGYSKQRDAGILSAFHRKSITRASLLVDGENARQAALLAKLHGIPLGLHFNITEGYPAPPVTSDICLGERRPRSSLVDASTGAFYDKAEMFKRARRGVIAYADVSEELRRQCALFKRYTQGDNPLYIDGHQHVHVLPTVAEAVATVAVETRLPYELELAGCTWIQPPQRMKFYDEVTRLASRAALTTYARRGTRYPDAFVGLSTMGLDMAHGHLVKALQLAFTAESTHAAHATHATAAADTTASRTVELMTHIGFKSRQSDLGCGLGADDFSRSGDREFELAMITSHGFKNWLREQNIELVSSV